jgi:aspartyl-tRNA(Asn)/glutamyl-tRNA(Gln) amidotransferase subunit B
MNARSTLPLLKTCCQDPGKCKNPRTLVEELGLAVVSDDAAIRVICAKVVAQNPAEVKSYREGKETFDRLFVGQVMRELRGKRTPS